jgi:serine/threonine kinase 16
MTTTSKKTRVCSKNQKPQWPQKALRPAASARMRIATSSLVRIPHCSHFTLTTLIVLIGNIMIDDDGSTPILMDLGSLAPSPTPITSRSLALQVQDLAAEHSTMPYRAPELFDVKTGSIIDTKVDIWSLGCTLYACLIGKSPFEFRSDETGGSLSICVLGGDWRFPDEGREAKKNSEEGVSEEVKDVVRMCLRLEPGERPDVDELIGVVEGVLGKLPEDGNDE